MRREVGAYILKEASLEADFCIPEIFDSILDRFKWILSFPNFFDSSSESSKNFENSWWDPIYF